MTRKKIEGRDSFGRCKACRDRFTPTHRNLERYLPDLPAHSGIYEIFHRSSYYIGISVNLRRRLREHFRALETGNHKSRRLSAFAKLVGGVKRLNVRIVWRRRTVDAKLLRKLETAHIAHRRRQHRQVFNRIYDTTKGGLPKHVSIAAGLKAAETKRRTGVDKLAARKAANTRAIRARESRKNAGRLLVS